MAGHALRKAATADKPTPGTFNGYAAAALPAVYVPRKRQYVAPAVEKMAAYGLEQILEDIVSGAMLTDIAKAIGVSIGSFLVWLDAEPERASRARVARSLAAHLWQERAEAVLREATNSFELQRAQALSGIYKWRATALRPQEYGDSLKVEHSGRVEHVHMTDAQLQSGLAKFSGLTIDEAGNIVDD